MRVMALLQLLLVVATASGRPQSKAIRPPPATAESVRRGGRVQRIGVALAIDWISAASCSAALTPAVAIIDKAIISASSGASPSLGAAIADNVAKMLANPLAFLTSPEFVLIFLVYLATWVAGAPVVSGTFPAQHSSRPPSLFVVAPRASPTRRVVRPD
jgi:hypothetical protein